MADQRALVAHLRHGELSLPKRRDTALNELAARLGHDFTDPTLLNLALTHSSAKASVKIQEDNERLEFLGDRVLGLAIVELLLDRFPDAHEGELAPKFNYLVRAETCAEVARDWDLGKLVTLTSGKVGSGILGDACEAVLGAIFIDGGYEAASAVVWKFWERRLTEIEDAAPDPKSVLQEWAQGRRLPLPLYLEIAREGPDHAPRFTAEVQVEGMPPERGKGATKRAAERAAALAMLVREGVWRAPQDG